jgi:signal transduction histidine kinase
MGMRERVEALGGRFRLESQPGRGVTVTAVIPVNAALANERDIRVA